MKKNNFVKKSDFGRIYDVYEYCVNSPDPKDLKKWEKIFREEWHKSAQDTEELTKNAAAWCSYAPPAARQEIFDTALSYAKTPLSSYRWLQALRIWRWKEEAIEPLKTAWEETSRAFVLSDDPIVLANGSFCLAPSWRDIALKEASRYTVDESDDEKVMILFSKIMIPGNLTDEAGRRFLETAKHREDAERIIMKLSMNSRHYNADGEPNPQTLSGDEVRKERAEALWEKVAMTRLLKAATITEAEDIIANFAPTDILQNNEACHCLAKLLENPLPHDNVIVDTNNRREIMANKMRQAKERYETGKRIYKLVIKTRERESLIMVPIMQAWYPALVFQLMDHHGLISNEELEELYELVIGEAKGLIADTYCRQIKRRNNGLC